MSILKRPICMVVGHNWDNYSYTREGYGPCFKHGATNFLCPEERVHKHSYVVTTKHFKCVRCGKGKFNF